MLEGREFRLWQGKTDPIYQNMMMCRDKSLFAVSRGKLNRHQQLLSALHDLTPGLLTDPEGRFMSMELIDRAAHGLVEYRRCEGDFSEKMGKLEMLLSEGEPAFVGTIHPLLPFSARYNPALPREDYDAPNHIFVILGKEKGRYIYFDTSSIQSPHFEAYPANPELGWIETDTLDALLKDMFELSYAVWHEECLDALENYGWQLLRAYSSEYDNQEYEVWDDPPGKYYRGEKALSLLKATLLSPELNLASPSWEHGFIEQGDMLNWKLTDLAKRRALCALWLEGEKRQEEAAIWREAGRLFEKLSTFMLYQREKGKYGNHPYYGALLDEIMAFEKKNCIFLLK